MSKTIVLVACVSKKQKNPQPAKDLYISDWFIKASVFAQQHADQWYILSAKYGLLLPITLIEPYNETLNTMPVANRRAWATHVLEKLLPLVQPGDRILILAGEKYRENLVEPLKRAGCLVEIPMQGMRIGEQLSWLKARVAR